MVVYWVILVLAFGTQRAIHSGELMFLREESDAIQWGLTLSLKVPFRTLFKISNSWPHLLFHLMFWPGKASPAARWMQWHLLAVL